MMSTEIDKLLRDEAWFREQLNSALRRRDECEVSISRWMARLNDTKRKAYELGFTGNVMRDANGDRVK